MVSEREEMSHVPEWRSRAAVVLAKSAFLIVKLIFSPVLVLVLTSRAISRQARPQALPTPFYKLDRARGDGGRR
jgi:hypothetical protein